MGVGDGVGKGEQLIEKILKSYNLNSSGKVDVIFFNLASKLVRILSDLKLPAKSK